MQCVFDNLCFPFVLSRRVYTRHWEMIEYVIIWIYRTYVTRLWNFSLFNSASLEFLIVSGLTLIIYSSENYLILELLI